MSAPITCGLSSSSRASGAGGAYIIPLSLQGTLALWPQILLIGPRPERLDRTSAVSGIELVRAEP